MILMPSGILPVILTAHGAAKMDRMRGPSSTTWGQYIISWVSYATSVFGCPTVMLDALHWHGCHTCTNQVLSPRVHPESKMMLFTRPPSLGRLGSSLKKALTAIPTNQLCQQTNNFHFTCDQNYSIMTLLITTKAVFFEKPTNKQKQFPYLTFNNQG